MFRVLAGFAWGCGAGSTPVPTAPPDDPQICEDERASLAPVDTRWSGDLHLCDPGPPVEEAHRAFVERVNFVRGLAGLPAVRAADPSDAQGCALLLHANGALSHDPPLHWRCYTPDRAAAAARSLLANTVGMEALRAMLIDPGNADTIGHRRWLLSSWIEGIALGSTSAYSCVDLVLAHAGGEAPDWVAWPPPGPTPVSFLTLGDYDVDRTGWTIQSDTLELEGHTVRLSWGDVVEDLPTTALLPGYGSDRAVRFVPSEPVPVGEPWAVELVGTPIAYSGIKVDCGEEP